MEEIIPNNILKVSHISASYQEGKQRKTVLHDISFELHENEILGLVGESGCGKSTLSKVILGFIRPDEGEIFSQVDHPQMIFQDPFSSLNPAKKISWILEEPLRMQKVPKEERKKRVLAMAERVGLSAEHLKRRPHELSGGQSGARPLGGLAQLSQGWAGQSHAHRQLQAQIIQRQGPQALQLLQQGIGLIGLGQKGHTVVVQHRPHHAVQAGVLVQKALHGEEQQLIPLLRLLQAVHSKQGHRPGPLGHLDLIPGRPVPDLLRPDLAVQQPGIKQLPQDWKTLLIPAAQALHVPPLRLLLVQLVLQPEEDPAHLLGVDGLHDIFRYAHPHRLAGIFKVIKAGKYHCLGGRQDPLQPPAQPAAKSRKNSS